MKGPIGLGLIAGIMLCAVSFTAAAQVASSYRLTLIWKRILDPDHENHEFEVTDINDKGQVSGWRLSDSAQDGAFIWRGGQFRIVLPPSGGVGSRALGINDWSELAGIYFTSPPDRTHGFFWRGGRLTEIAVVPGENELSPVHLNNHRQVIVLSRHPEAGAQYFIWQRGEVTPLEGVLNRGVDAHRINDRGVVVGQALGDGGTSVPLLWQDGAAMLLDPPEGAIRASGDDVNDHDTVVVNALLPGRSAAYRWHEGEYTALPGLPGRASTRASAINNSGVVVGSSSDESVAGPAATVWYGVQAADLNSLVRANDPLKAHVRLHSALLLNDRGEIVARGIDLRDFDQFGAPADNHYLLTPID
jgi:uncharacterized membrane protein